MPRVSYTEQRPLLAQIPDHVRGVNYAMALKIAILLVFGLMLISLASGLFYLFKDQGKSKHTFHSLGVRATMAVLLMILLGYGAATGQLKSKAPWAYGAAPAQSTGADPK